ncbi:cell cycle checkpoint control protein RAD9B isoform X9 [Falco biarmicus]|uniref:cell cycle checkpoint control protein RAD9B isoform X9 n=1 Tax=Falco cherrug TaxID=345164 RepID=UPI00247A89F3|nr:cell cycle checkpoint control protein RAD9B isoform X9 [Falco cherrug]XP_056182241.1 cell cycle checkpoint control protein RAD9B isoform X9 [Falco biarmicus]
MKVLLERVMFSTMSSVFFRTLFGRAIHAIARISDEFWFDPVEKGLALRSVNSSRSAYAYVFFSSMFFQHYCWTAVSQPCQKKKQLFHPYKLIIKSVLPIFRCVNVLERNVEKCSIYTNIYDHHITFQLLCKHDFSKTMLTEIQLNPDEFDYFQVGVDSEVTFCLKELRGLLAFSETTSVPVSIHFDVSGKPVAFSVEDTVLEASFILATLSEAEKETAFQQPPGFSQQWESSKTHTGKCEETSMGKGSNAAAAASKKPQWNGNTPNTGSAKPPSPLAKREIKNTARATRTAMTKAEDHAALEGEATVSHYQKFHTLFFGAVSCRKDAISHTFHSLATASDTEEDFGNMECSPVL